jgi:hypothetical protein
MMKSNKTEKLEQIISNKVNALNIKKRSKAIKRAMKAYAQVQSNSNISFSGNSYDLCLITAGYSAVGTRVNNKVRFAELFFNATFYLGTLTISSILENTIHFMLVRWIDSTVAGNPNASDLLDPVTSGVGTALAPLVPANRSQSDSQFIILHDEIIQLDQYHPTRLLQLRKKVDWDSEFDGNTTGSNHIVAFVISDDGVATYPTWEFSSQLLFSDSSD